MPNNTNPQPADGDDELQDILKFDLVLKIRKEKPDLYSDAEVTAVIQEAEQAIRAKYISRERVEAAIGEDEEGRMQTVNMPTPRIMHRNDLRHELRRELGLQGETDE